MPNLPPYLHKNAHIIKKLSSQSGFKWKRKYSNFKIDQDVKYLYEIFITKYDKWDNGNINRDIVIDIFNPRNGYSNRIKIISVMIWGGIDTGRLGNHFGNLLAMNPARISRIFSIIEKWLNRGKVNTAFNALESCLKLKGVGHAFHTKLLYYIGNTASNLKPKPLIFDLRTKNAYCAMLLDNKDPRHLTFFTSVRNATSGKPYVDVRSGQLTNAYMAYIHDMDCWASQIGIPSWQLEQFIFGWHRNQSNPYAGTFNNPRQDIERILLVRDGQTEIRGLENTISQYKNDYDENFGEPPCWELLSKISGSAIYFAPTAWLPWNEEFTKNVPSMYKRKLIFELWPLKTHWKITLLGYPGYNKRRLFLDLCEKFVPPENKGISKSRKIGYAVWREYPEFDPIIQNEIPWVNSAAINANKLRGSQTYYSNAAYFYDFLDTWVALIDRQLGGTGRFWEWVDNVSLNYKLIFNE